VEGLIPLLMVHTWPGLAAKFASSFGGTRVDELIVRMSRQIALMRQAHKGHHSTRSKLCMSLKNPISKRSGMRLIAMADGTDPVSDMCVCESQKFLKSILS